MKGLLALTAYAFAALTFRCPVTAAVVSVDQANTVFNNAITNGFGASNSEGQSFTPTLSRIDSAEFYANVSGTTDTFALDRKLHGIDAGGFVGRRPGGKLMSTRIDPSAVTPAMLKLMGPADRARHAAADPLQAAVVEMLKSGAGSPT